MKYALMASVALFVIGTSATIAAVPAIGLKDEISKPASLDLLQLASDDDNGGDDNGGDNNSGGGGDDDGDDDDGDDAGDDHGGDHHDGVEHRSNDQVRSGGSGGRRARVPGGSGCDSARDKIEHPECNTN